MSTSPVRCVFAGTPDFAATILQALLDSALCRIVAVYTQPDRPAGRGRRLVPPPVKQLADSHGVAVYQPASLKGAKEQAELATLQPELMIVAAYGLILPPAVLAMPRHGCINVHASLLPRWRGAAPIERAMEAGDTQTGVTIMQMDAGLDTGAVLLARACAISDADSGGSLRERLAGIGRDAILETLEQLIAGRLTPQPQDDRLASHAPKLRREEAVLDWQLPAAVLARRVRAFNPANVCQTTVAGEVLRVWFAEPCAATTVAQPGEIVAAERDGIVVACGDGALRLTHLQLAGARAMDAAALLNGRAALFRPGTLLGAAAGD
ncbi:MAG: methionyl-tRNA formyltransferase [Pseudomonadales bacterium]|jgi:methionyl-tRNA formyltransferase|nr:methionyl-tRNA formyltransferase [Pseudomonadales bacterium]MCP5337229.1 methionyl-tRNA formyltransferase [Pseudomonadales bacterium]